MRLLNLLIAVSLTPSVAGCAFYPGLLEGEEAAGAPAPAQLLSDYGFFVGELAELQPADGVIPYEPVAPLWSDGALKQRFIALPEGESIAFGEGEDWLFPLGSVVIKHFAFALDRRKPNGEQVHVETRLMTLGEGGWSGEVYLWNREQTDAERFLPGRLVGLELADEDGSLIRQDYVVPNRNHCSSCHERDDETHLLGTITVQLNGPVERDGSQVEQLDWLAEQGLFREPIPSSEQLPALVRPQGDAPLEDRARAYLHANCSHCHRPGANAAPSGLFFLHSERNPTNYGVCKRPVAAGAGSGGRDFDIVPGEPDASIVTYRIESTDPGGKMPELPNLLPHAEGVKLIRDWIEAMPPRACE